MTKKNSKGEIATLVTLGGLLILTAASLVANIFLIRQQHADFKIYE